MGWFGSGRGSGQINRIKKNLAGCIGSRVKMFEISRVASGRVITRDVRVMSRVRPL